MKKILLLMMFWASFAVGATEWTKGEIRRVDMLRDIATGDQVEFVAEQRGTKLFAKQLKKIQ